MPDASSYGSADIPLDLERRFLEILDRPAAEHSELLEALCRAHPGHASALRAWYADSQHVGDGGDAPVRLGPYRIVRRLGAGGMGTVYLGEQDAPVKRRVAIKLARETVEADVGWRRFELEQQVLASMEHTAIAKVFDAGRDPQGRPYLVMELIEGEPITTYCDGRSLGLEARLGLLREVCAGVQHAHEKGVIHRDLKPSNILVVEESGRPMPKVIDFGLARVIDAGAHPLHTHSDLVLGTPAYMSPEQAGLARDLDTRTDVYGLGVVLYELLTGDVPLTKSELARLAREEMLRRIRDAEPPAPSRRALGAERRIAEERGTSTAVLARRLRGDLDWITLRALARERERRYGSAGELGDEIGRYLRREPVHAGPPGAWYRVRRFVSRHRAACGAAGGIAIAVLGGLVLSTLAWRETAAKVREFDNLALVVQLQHARASADELFPALPVRVAAIEAWLAEFGFFEQLAAPVDAFLRDLRAQGRAASATERATLAERDQEQADLTNLQEEYAGLQRSLATGAAERANEVQRHNAGVRRAILEPKLAALRARVRDRSGHVFHRPADTVLHNAVTTFRHDLGEFLAADGLLAEVRARLRFARELEARTIDAPAAAWAEAAAVVLADPRFAGFTLLPQLGLVPLGRSPQSGLCEFLHLGSHAPEAPYPGRTADGEVAFDAGCGVILVLLPGGTFTMGEQDRDPDAPNYDPDADPTFTAHRVTLAPFFLAKHEITQAQWRRMSVGQEPSSYSARMASPYGTPDWTCPVEMITWAEARTVLGRHDLLLPTEAQWEYACRAGTTTRWWTGDTVASLEGAANVPDRAVAAANLAFGGPAADFFDGFIGPAPVHALRKNPFGLHHMHGNVWEWCEDFEGEYSLPVRSGDGLREVPSLLSRRHIYRGGSFYERIELSRSAYRWSEPDSVHWEVTGVRAARRVETSR